MKSLLVWRKARLGCSCYDAGMMITALKAGDTAPVSGAYGLFEMDGRFSGIARVLSQGEVLPAEPASGMYYRLMAAEWPLDLE